MRGNITKRGKGSWRIKFDAGTDPATGKRNTQFVTVRGTKKEAEAELSRRLAQVDEGEFVAKSATTVTEYCRFWLKSIAPAKASAKTLERYGEIVEKHIVPRLGATTLQKLDGSRIDEFYNHLRSDGRLDGKGALSAQTVLHIHRLLSQVLASAVKAKKVRHSPMEGVQTTPKVRREEIQVLTDDEQIALLRYMKTTPIYMQVLIATATGMRRGEILGLRWADILFDRNELKVAQVLEQTKDVISFKVPKTDRSRRTISLPASIMSRLRTARAEQAALRLKLGLGKTGSDLIFCDLEGKPLNPRNFSKQFAAEADSAELGHVTFHGLRHTHITHLLRSGVPVHVVSARAGHANPAVTLNIYAHLLPGQQEGAAAIVDMALRSALED